MTPEERETLYDREIAPVLLDLAAKCKDGEMSLVAVVEWAPNTRGRTMTIREDVSTSLRMVLWAIEADANADILIWRMQQHGREHGHNSVCLHNLERSTP